MKKEDFHKGKTVWVYLTGNAARGKKTTEERIQEWEVVSVGRKYIIARPKGMKEWWNVKFDITNNFRQDTIFTADYELYLAKEDILHDVWRENTRSYIREFATSTIESLNYLSDEDLLTVSEIFRKYFKEGE